MSGVHAGLSDLGKVRAENQDRLVADSERGIYLVADGMGGLPGGESAAGLVAEQLPALLARHLDGVGDLTSDSATQASCAALAELNATIRRSHPGTGAAVVAACFRGAAALVVSLGDSRAYQLRDRHLQRLTQDHTVAQLLVGAGDLTVDQAMTHPGRHQLTRYLGMTDVPAPDIRVIRFVSGDKLLLCSDGLTGALADAQIETVLNAHSVPDDACRALIEAANAGGGLDNISVVIVNCRAVVE